MTAWQHGVRRVAIACMPVGGRQVQGRCTGRRVRNGSGVGSRQLGQLQRGRLSWRGYRKKHACYANASGCGVLPPVSMPGGVQEWRDLAIFQRSCYSRWRNIATCYSKGQTENRLMAGFFVVMIVSLRLSQISQACSILRSSVCDIFGIRLCGTRLFSDRLKTSKTSFLMTDLAINLKLGSMFLCQ